MKKLFFNILTFCFLTLFITASPFAAFADITPSPTQFQPALDYTGNPHYSPYYYFAKEKLFDGVDFFTSTQSNNSVSCPIATPTDETSLNAQLTSWGFKVEGSAETLDLLQETFATVCLLNQSPYYVEHLGAQKNQIIISFDSRGGGGGGCTDYAPSDQDCVGGNEESRLYDHEPIVHLFNSRANATEENRFFISHELGHVFSSRNNDIQQSFNASVFPVPPQLSSINCAIVQAQTYEENECFADAVGLYLVYPSFTAWASDFTDINNYPTGKYKLYYDFVKANIFGGTDFFATPSNGANALADYATDLANAIKNTCGKFVTSGNAGCLTGLLHATNIPLDHMSDVINILQASAAGGTLQCVGFVQGATIGFGEPVGIHGNAADFAKISIPGYTWIPNSNGFSFQEGDILIQKWGPDVMQEHIAIVTQVNGDTITVAQANGDHGSVEVVPRDISSVSGTQLLGVQRPN